MKADSSKNIVNRKKIRKENKSISFELNDNFQNSPINNLKDNNLKENSIDYEVKLKDEKNQLKINYNNIINLNIDYKKQNNNNLEVFLNNNIDDININKDDKNKKSYYDKFINTNNNIYLPNSLNEDNNSNNNNSNKKIISLNLSQKEKNFNNNKIKISYPYSRNSRIENKIMENSLNKNNGFLTPIKLTQNSDNKHIKINKTKNKLSYTQIINNSKLFSPFKNDKKSKFNLWKTRNNPFKYVNIKNSKNNKNKSQNFSKNSSFIHIEEFPKKIKKYKDLSNYLNIPNNNNKNKLNKTYLYIDKLDNNKNKKSRNLEKINIKKYYSYDKENENKINDLINDFKTKVENNKNQNFIKNKEMINEIQILKEKLKIYSQKNSSLQKEIEYLKKMRFNNNVEKEEKINDKNNISDFQMRLNNITEKYSYKKNNVCDFLNKDNDNINESKIKISINNNEKDNYFNKLNLVNKLFKIFNLEDMPSLNKDNFILKEECNSNMDEKEIEQENNYDKIFIENPQLKNFIKELCKKLKEEKVYREKLEEKTIQIFNNDIKTIDMLEKKLKKYENNQKNKLNRTTEYINTELNNSIKLLSE